MARTKSKMIIFSAMILSLFAVAVSTISTAAWFQVNTSSSDMNNRTNDMVTGSTDIEVNNVTGYKFNYDEINESEVSTANGAVIGATDSATGNVDEDPLEEIDQPTEGVGYYMLFKNANDEYKYTDPSTVKMDDQYSENHAFKSVAVAQGDKIIIKKHSYNNDGSGTKTTNAELKNFSIALEQASYFTYSENTAEFTANTTGTYHFYINYQEKITWTWQSGTGPVRNAKRNAPIIKRAAASKSYIYVDISSFASWNDYGPHCCIYFSGGEAKNSSTVGFTNNVAPISIPAGVNAGTIYIKRVSNGDPNTVWNSTGGSTRCEFSLYYDPALAGQTINVTNWNAGSWSVTSGTYIIGEGGSIGSTNTWTLLSGVSMNDTPTDSNKAQKQTTLEQDTIFRVFSTTSNPTSSSDVQYKNWDGALTNDNTALAASGDNKRTTRKVACTIYLNNSNTVYVAIAEHEITLLYKRYSDSTGNTPIAGDASNWQTYGEAIGIFSGTAPSLPANPDVPGYVWCEAWYTDEECETPYEGETFTNDDELYTKFLLPTYEITIVIATTTENSREKSDYSDPTPVTGLERASNEEISTSWLDTNSLSHALTNDDYDFLGYFRESSLSGGSFTGGPISSAFLPTGDETIYKVYSPKVTITVDVVYTGIGENISKVAGNASTGNVITTKYASGSSIATSALDTATSSWTYNNSDYYFAGYWNDKDNSGNLTNQISSSYSVTTSDTIYKVYRPKLTITINGVYCVDDTLVEDGGTSRESTTMSLSGIRLSTTTINNTLPDFDTTNYISRSYYQSLSGSPSTLSIEINSTGYDINSNTIIYVRLQPKQSITVTYNYRFFTKNVLTNAETAYSNIPTNSGRFQDGTEQVTNVYYRNAYTANPGKDTAYSFDSTLKAGYKFEKVGIYTNAACTTEFINGSHLTSDQQLYVKMVAEYEDMHVSVRCSSDEWRNTNLGTNKIQLHFAYNTSEITADYGDYQGYYDLTRGSDGIFNFRITDGIKFQICNNHSGTPNSRTTYDYTSEITSYNQNDSNGNSRGVCNTIQVIDSTDGNRNRKWVWSNYYGGNARSATLCSTTSSQRKEMVRGDGTFNMYVFDAGIRIESGQVFAVKFDNGGDVTWYDFDNLNSSSQAFVTNAGSKTENELTGSGSSSNVVDKAFEFTVSGTYNFYLTATGELSIASVPAGKGDGFYIMPYTGTTATYNGAVKLRNTGINGDGNVAYYKFFETTAANQKFYIRSYINGIDNGVITNYGTDASASMDGNGVINIATAGRYNIYVKRVGSTYTIYINKVNTATYNFFTLNKFEGEATKDKNTTLVLEIKCRATSAQETKMGAIISRTTTSGGISRYLKFNVFCSATKLGNTCYQYMRNNYWSTAQSFTGNDSKSLSLYDETNTIPANTNDYYYVYILIDYSASSSTIKSNIAALTNDFRIIITGSSM